MKKILLVIVAFSTAFIGLTTNTNASAIHDDLPELFIKSVNPGYTIDGQSNVGEIIEISKSSDQPISLAGATISYMNSSGKSYILYEFPEYSWLNGETILLRLASSPGAELASVNYTKTLAMSGTLLLQKGEEVLDQVCWTGKDACYTEFKSSTPTTLLRNLETNQFEHVSDYIPTYDEQSYFLENEESDNFQPASQCKGLVFSELLSYYETSSAEQFIEFRNMSAEQILMDGCKIKYKNKTYPLNGIIKPDAYFVYHPAFSLTKNPVNGNLLEIIDADDTVIDRLTYPNGQHKGTSYAFIGYDLKGEEVWHVTYAPTPGAPNNYQEFKTCEVGKVINEATGNCVKVADIKTTICKEGQYLNILTGRCKKIETAAAKTCKEGYYLNPDTNRCRKIKENDGANYSLTPETYEEKSSFIALFAVIGVVSLGLIYIIYEFRHEILKLLRKVFRRAH